MGNFSKLHELRGDLPVSSVVNTRCTFIRFSDRFKIKRGRRCAWVTATMWENFSFSPNICTLSDTGKRVLNTPCTL